MISERGDFPSIPGYAKQYQSSIDRLKETAQLTERAFAERLRLKLNAKPVAKPFVGGKAVVRHKDRLQRLFTCESVLYSPLLLVFLLRELEGALPIRLSVESGTATKEAEGAGAVEPRFGGSTSFALKLAEVFATGNLLAATSNVIIAVTLLLPHTIWFRKMNETIRTK